MTKQIESERIAFWLLPAANGSAHLQKKINQLATRFDAAHFIPHLTLLALPTARVSAPTELLDHISAKTAPLALDCSGAPQWSQRYTEALTLSVDTSAELLDLITSLHPDRHVTADYRPHLSLLYANLNQQTGEQLEQEFAGKSETFLFDRIALISIGPQTTTATDVKAWKMITTRPLSQKES